MIKRFTALLGILLAVIAPAAWGQADFYVSTNGNDNGRGTQAAPFRSVVRAQRAVRELPASRRGRDIVVQIQPGEYFLDAPLRFGPEDGGTATHRVTYRGPGRGQAGQVVIHSGRAVTNWQPVSDSSGVYRALLPAARFRQLYVDGERAIRARYPNQGTYLESAGWDYKDQELIVLGKHPLPGLDWPGPDWPGLEVMLLQSWAESYLRVKSVSTYGLSFHKFTRVRFQDEEAKILFNRPYPMHEPAHRLYFENARELVDAGQEWFHEESSGTLYYQPPTGADMNRLRVVYPTLDTLLVVRGTAEKPVVNLHFENLSFQYANWTYASEHGYLNAQAGQHNYRAERNNDQYVYRPPAAVYVARAERVSFVRNAFSNLGSTGLDLHYGTRHCAVVGNTFNDIAGSAVALAKFTQDASVEYHTPYNPSDATEVCYADTIANNLIERVANYYFGCVGIAAGYPSNAQIVHNTIRDLPYSGISVGYGWTDQPNPMTNNLIAHNDVSNVVNLLNDGAALYTLSYQPGTRLYRNYLHDLRPPQERWQRIKYAIYCDEKTGGSASNPFVIEENVLENVPGEIKLHQSGIMSLRYALHRAFQRDGRTIVEQAGLEPAYRDLLQKTLAADGSRK